MNKLLCFLGLHIWRYSPFKRIDDSDQVNAISHTRICECCNREEWSKGTNPTEFVKKPKKIVVKWPCGDEIIDDPKTIEKDYRKFL